MPLNYGDPGGRQIALEVSRVRTPAGHRRGVLLLILAHGNACGDALVTRFLATGKRPAHDAFCPAG